MHTSNPDIGISRAVGTEEVVQKKEWGKKSDHRPVIFKVRTKLRLHGTRKRVVESMFYCPKEIEDARKA